MSNRALATLSRAPENLIGCSYALFVSHDGFFSSRAVQFVILTARDRIRTSYADRDFVAAGGQMSYGIDMLKCFIKPVSLPADSKGSKVPSGLLSISEEVIV